MCRSAPCEQKVTPSGPWRTCPGWRTLENAFDVRERGVSGEEHGMPSPITDYDDKVAVVTGGASGVGCALARMLLDRGAHVVIADVEQSAIDRAVDALRPRASTKLSGVRTDVSDIESVHALAHHVFHSFEIGRAA